MSTKHLSQPIGGRLYFDDSPIGTIMYWMKSRYAITQTALVTSTADSYTENHLKDSAESFSTISVGDIVYNSTDKIFAVVLSVSANDLTLDYNAFPDGNENYAVYDEPELPSGWVEANGQTLNDPDSDFTVAPLINDDNSTLYDSGLSSEYANELIVSICKIKSTPTQIGDAWFLSTLDVSGTTTLSDIILGVGKKLGDADGDTYIEVEETSDKDEIVAKVAGVEAQRIHDNGIIDFPKQSACRVTRNTAQSIPNVTWTIVQYDTVEYDLQNEYDNITNYRYTAKEDGYYHVDASLLSASVSWPANATWELSVFLNGVQQIEGYRTVVFTAGTWYLDAILSSDIYLAKNDYIDIRVWQGQGNTINTYTASIYNYFNVHKFA